MLFSYGEELLATAHPKRENHPLRLSTITYSLLHTYGITVSFSFLKKLRPKNLEEICDVSLQYVYCSSQFLGLNFFRNEKDTIH
jgi:hypothetical protein